jgi:hypothetical protein
LSASSVLDGIVLVRIIFVVVLFAVDKNGKVFEIIPCIEIDTFSILLGTPDHTA